MIYVQLIPIFIWFFIFWLISRALNQWIKLSWKAEWKEIVMTYAMTIILIIYVFGHIGDI